MHPDIEQFYKKQSYKIRAYHLAIGITLWYKYIGEFIYGPPALSQVLCKEEKGVKVYFFNQNTYSETEMFKIINLAGFA